MNENTGELLGVYQIMTQDKKDAEWRVARFAGGQRAAFEFEQDAERALRKNPFFKKFFKVKVVRLEVEVV